MFTAVAHKNLVKAETYFDEHFSQNDYYTAENQRAARWIGQGVERLRLEGPVTRERFQALCRNRHPGTGEQLTLRQNSESHRRVLFDVTCSAPKSVSVLALTMGDGRLVDAHEEAARIAFRELETFAATRIRKGGKQQDRTTANLVAAAFLHTSSRALDPQLHTHFTVMNGTFDPQEKVWKALQSGPMFAAFRYATEVYRNELAARVQAIGYRTRMGNNSIEIEGVDEAILRRFSKRAQQRDEAVRALEKALGRKLSDNEVAAVVHRTRPDKIRGLTENEVRLLQRQQLKPEEVAALVRLKSNAQVKALVVNMGAERMAVQEAAGHIFERQSVVAEPDLLAAALHLRCGHVDLPALKQSLHTTKELLPVPGGWSTRAILETELFLIRQVREGKEAVQPLNTRHLISPALGEDQRRAVGHVLASGDRITGLRGLAGSGKTTTLRELAQAIEQSGTACVFCAPTAAATTVLREEGFAASTLQSLLRSPPPSSSVVVLDEAGAVGIDDMKQLFQLGGRVILSGDTGQHSSVPRGDALRIIEEHSPYLFGQLTQIRRQRRADYREVVELAARKQTGDAFDRLVKQGAVQELEADQVPVAAAKAYHHALKEGRSALLVAPTWNEIESVTKQVRETLKQAGTLNGPEQMVQVFHPLSWTHEEKQVARQYRPGLVLRFHQTQGRFKAGESVEVSGVGPDAITIRRANGTETKLRLSRNPARFEVGELKALAVMPGERLLLRTNADRHRFVNGELVTVKAVEDGAVVLTDGRTLPKGYNAFTHGYAVTSHAAQGKTVDEVLIVASFRSLAAVHQQQFYVSVSRGRERCQVFTDDAERLRAHVLRANVRTAVIETLPLDFRTPRRPPLLRSLVHRTIHLTRIVAQRFHLGPGRNRLVPRSRAVVQPMIQPRHETTGIRP